MSNVFENAPAALATELSAASELKSSGKSRHRRQATQPSLLSNGDRLLTMRSVIAITSSSRSSIDRWRKAGDFPRARQLSLHRIGFLESEVRAWIASRKPV